jgi:hypothetical protein
MELVRWEGFVGWPGLLLTTTLVIHVSGGKVVFVTSCVLAALPRAHFHLRVCCALQQPSHLRIWHENKLCQGVFSQKWESASSGGEQAAWRTYYQIQQHGIEFKEKENAIIKISYHE